jgi:hypothetical protein
VDNTAPAGRQARPRQRSLGPHAHGHERRREERRRSDVGHQRHAPGGRDVGAPDHLHHHDSGDRGAGAPDLPKATNLPTQTKPENITISVDKDGNMYWNTKLLPKSRGAQGELRGIARIDPQPEVHIRGDSDVRYQFVGQVLVSRRSRSASAKSRS